MLGNVANMMARLHRDEQGSQGLEKLLIVAAVVLPLLGLLIWFRDDIGRWVSQKWDQYRTPALTDPVRPSPSQGP